MEEPKEKEDEDEGEEDEKDDKEKDKEDMTNLLGKESSAPGRVDFGCQSKEAVTRNSEGTTIYNLCKGREMSVALVSTVRSFSIQRSSTNDAKKPNSSLLVTSRVWLCQRHVRPREAQPSRVRISYLRA